MEYYYHYIRHDAYSGDRGEFCWKDLNNALEFIKKAVPDNIIKFIQRAGDSGTEIALKLDKVNIDDREVIIDYKVNEVRNIISLNGCLKVTKDINKPYSVQNGAIIMEENLTLYKFIHPSSLCVEDINTSVYKCNNGFVRQLNNGRFVVDFDLFSELTAAKDNNVDEEYYRKVDTIRVIVYVGRDAIEFRDEGKV